MSEQLRTLPLWLPTYLRQQPAPQPDGVKDILLCVCDHLEPLHRADKSEARCRMAQWKTEFPKNIAPFRDTEATLRAKLLQGIADFTRQGFLPRDAAGRTRWGFVHGDWALDNSHPDGAQCGVNNELSLLRELGCYADFTLPSCPDPTQTRTINRLYYAQDTPHPKSHDTGVQVRVLPAGGSPPLAPIFGDLLIIQGPLALNWERRKLGFLPRLENSDLTVANLPRLWLKQHIHVLGRPEWTFVKLHCHGAPPPNSGVFLGEPYRAFHQHLAETYTEANGWRLQYVTARELVNILHAAEDGHSGNAGEFRDYRYKLPG